VGVRTLRQKLKRNIMNPSDKVPKYPFCPSEFYTVEGSSSKKQTEEELQLKDPEERTEAAKNFKDLVDENEVNDSAE
jgi:hypothetical protein